MKSPRTPLQTAIFNSGYRQIEIAGLVGIHETRLSKIAHGHLEASDTEKEALAGVLNARVADLFPQAIAS